MGAGDEPMRPDAPAVRDGSHDFDFNLGAWNSRVKRYLHPLSRPTEFIELQRCARSAASVTHMKWELTRLRRALILTPLQ